MALEQLDDFVIPGAGSLDAPAQVVSLVFEAVVPGDPTAEFAEGGFDLEGVGSFGGGFGRELESGVFGD